MLITVLVFILVTSLAASSMVVAHKTQLQRDKEEQLLFAGGQIRKAIASYYHTIPPGGARSLPPSLDALLNDPRFPRPVQHLRRIYSDPMTGQADWELVREGSGVIGVKSRSAGKVIRKKGLGKANELLEDKELYSEWVFSISR